MKLKLLAVLLASASCFGASQKTISYPGASQTYVRGINGTGVCGWYVADSSHGFLEQNGEYHRYDFPGSISTVVEACDNGVLVGVYTDQLGMSHAFIFSLANHRWVSFDHPRAIPGSTVLSAVEQDRIAGWYSTLSGKVVSFVISKH